MGGGGVGVAPVSQWDQTPLLARRVEAGRLREGPTAADLQSVCGRLVVDLLDCRCGVENLGCEEEED